METSGAWIRNLVKRLSMCVILADTQGLKVCRLVTYMLSDTPSRPMWDIKFVCYYVRSLAHALILYS